MVAERQLEPAQPGKARPRSALAALFMALLVAVVSVTVFCTVCTGFWSYDDMGFLMLTQKTLAAGHPLYDQTFSAYGPAYYAWEQVLRAITRLPLSHDSILLFTTGSIVMSALLGAGYVARLGRSLSLAAFTFLAVATLLLVMKSEAGHPQELCALLLTGMLAGAAFLVARRPATLLGLVGFFVGVLSMTKPNLGVFAAVGASAALCRLAPRGGLRHLLCALSALAALTLPIALMRHNLPAVAGYCAVTSAAILFLLLHLAAWQPEETLPWGHFAVAIGGFLVAVLGSVAYALATGTSCSGLAQGLFLQHVAFDQLFSFYSPFANRDVLLPLGVAVCAYVATGPGRGRCSFWPWLPSALKIAAAPFMVVAVLGLGITQAFIWCLPLVAATAGPLPGQPRGGLASRYFALSLSVLNGLWGYPIWGSQAGLSFFLLIPVAMVSCADAVRYGYWAALKTPDDGRTPSGKAPAGVAFWRTRTAWQGLALAAAAGVLALASLQAAQALSAYKALETSALPGSRLLHMPREQADFYRQAIASARSHGRSFFTMPGLGSLYFWADAEPPTAINPTTWMTLLTPAQQAQVVSDLAKTPDLCVIRWNPQVEFWTRGRDISGSRVVRYIEDNFITVESFNGCDIMVRKAASGR
jgi:hypothetical protein